MSTTKNDGGPQMTTPTKRSAKARKMWASTVSDWSACKHKDFFSCEEKSTLYRVAVLSLTPEANAKRIELAADASDKYFDSINGNHEAFKASEHALCILTALGLTPAKKTKAL